MEAFDAFLRFAETGDESAKRKCLELNKAHRFVQAAVSSLAKAQTMRAAGF